MAGERASLSRRSSSASSELPSLDDLIQEQVTATQIKQQQPDSSDDGSKRPARERSSSSSSSSDVIIISESSIANNSGSITNNNNIANNNSIANNSSNNSNHGGNSNSGSRRSSTLAAQSISGSVNNDNKSSSNNDNSSSSNNGDSMDMDMDMDDHNITATTPDKDDGNNADIYDDNSPIPHLTSISAAVFVPISDSNNLLQPLNLDAASPEYHRAALDLVTRHESSVRDNLNALVHREIYRVRADIANNSNSMPPFDYAAARAHVRAVDEDLLRRDCDVMIANMRAPDVSNKYVATRIPVPDMAVPVTYAPVGSPREFAAEEVMKVIAAAVGDLTAFDRHVRNRRATIKKQIQDAEARMGPGRMDID